MFLEHANDEIYDQAIAHLYEIKGSNNVKSTAAKRILGQMSLIICTSLNEQLADLALKPNKACSIQKVMRAAIMLT